MGFEKWPSTVLGELTNNFDSIRVPVKGSDRRSGPYPYYGASGIVDYIDDYLFEGEHLLIAEDGENLRSRKTPIAFLADGKFWVNNHAHIVTGNKRALTKYLCYALAVTDIRPYLSGSTMPKLTQNNLNRIPVIEPPLPIQQKIVSILGSLDDKIELNRRLNQTLEAIAQAIFQSWFVDFDPVKAKMTALAHGYDPERAAMAALSSKLTVPKDPADISTAMLDEAESRLSELSADQLTQLKQTAGLFPIRLVESELGLIPEGWCLEPIGKHIEATRGLSYKGAGLASDGIPLHNLNSVNEGGGYKYEGIKYYTLNYKERHVTQPGDILVANTEQGFDHLLIGYGAIVPKFYPMGLFSHHIYRIRPKSNSTYNNFFIAHLFRPGKFRQTIAGYTNGTTVNMLPADALEKPLSIVPPKELADNFRGMVEPIYDKCEMSVLESNSLSKLRDTLLPKLLSGKLSVADAETMSS